MGSAGADDAAPPNLRQLVGHGAFWLTDDGTWVTCWVPPDAAVAGPGEFVTTNPRTLSFYGRLGFRTLEVVRPVAALPPIWSLWREPSR
jgi:hypothetical protein